MEICELSDLPVDQCACRIHGPKEAPTAGSSPIMARYRGFCTECRIEIEIGERIVGTTAGRYVHEDCA